MKICDTHNDFPTVLKGKSFFKYLNYCENAGVEIMLASIYTTEMHNPLCAIKNIIHNILCYSGKVKVLCHIEDLGFLKNEEDLKTIISLKPFSCGIVWNNENSVAIKSGLTKFGKTVVEKLVENNIIVDLAHANEKTFWDSVKIIKKHIFVSHTGFSYVNKSKRNLTDKQAKAVFKSKGFIGLFLVKKFMGENLKPHISHAKKLGGQNFVGIGTDYFGSSDILSGSETYEKLINLVPQNILHKNFISFLKRVENEK